MQKHNSISENKFEYSPEKVEFQYDAYNEKKLQQDIKDL